MLEASHDQALGLRRLFAGREARMYSLLGAHGTTQVTLELAAALAGHGRRVLLVDRTCGEIGAGLGCRTRYDLLHVLRGEKALDDVLQRARDNVFVLPAARALAALEHGDPVVQRHLAQHLAAARARFDDCLVNGLAPAPHDDNSARDVILLAAPSREAVYEAYATIKRLVPSPGRYRLRLVVDRARSEGAARSIYASLAQTARRFLSAQLDYAGCLPAATAAAPRAAAVARLAACLAQETTPRFAAA